MRLSRIPHSELLGAPLPDPDDTEADLAHHLGLARFTDAGFPWFAPIGQRLVTHIRQVVRREMERAGYAEFRGPAVHRVETLAPAGWLERFGGELIGFSAPFEQYTLAATSEEPLLSWIGSAGLASHRQLPMRLFEFREIFRFRDRPQSIYNSRQFQCCLFASLDTDHTAYLASAAHAQRTVRAVLDRLRLRAELVRDEATGGFEFIFPYARGDRPRSRTIPYHRDAARPRTAEDDIPQGGVAMGYGYTHTPAFDVRFRDEDNQLRTPVMGTYGIGVQRCVLALLEQHRVAEGIALPAAVRPFDVTVTVQGRDPGTTEAAERVYRRPPDPPRRPTRRRSRRSAGPGRPPPRPPKPEPVTTARTTPCGPGRRRFRVTCPAPLHPTPLRFTPPHPTSRDLTRPRATRVATHSTALGSRRRRDAPTGSRSVTPLRIPSPP
ncbi:hypothetical protein ABT404_19610 [Streptomyces hyaluromycini]|uniref:Aminoacyl-transfer RNA synthetases class-II family profile domain-containing protein n=1 Tax=Streptomyces hyaluromycini TaxID=1377993 RepID=A0ABV1WY11_9ACTN